MTQRTITIPPHPADDPQAWRVAALNPSRRLLNALEKSATLRHYLTAHELLCACLSHRDAPCTCRRLHVVLELAEAYDAD